MVRGDRPASSSSRCRRWRVRFAAIPVSTAPRSWLSWAERSGSRTKVRLRRRRGLGDAAPYFSFRGNAGRWAGSPAAPSDSDGSNHETLEPRPWVLVRNLPTGTTGEALEKLFSDCGNIAAVSKQGNATVGCVMFETMSDAEAAAVVMNERELKGGQKLAVERWT